MIVEGVQIKEKKIGEKKYPFFMGMLTMILLMDETGLNNKEVLQKINDMEKSIKNNTSAGMKFFVDFFWCTHLAAVTIMDEEPHFSKNTIWAFLEIEEPGELMGVFASDKNPRKPQAR